MGDVFDFVNKMGEFHDSVNKKRELKGEMGQLVELYVYDLTKSIISHASSKKSSCSLGVGTVGGSSFFYHTSIVVFGNEYTFSETKGIYVDYETCKPEKTHVLGYTRKTKNELEKFLEDLRSTFYIGNYDLLERNCQVFCKKLCEFLEVEGLPEYVTQMRQFAQDIFGTQTNLEVAAGVAGMAAVAGVGYLLYKGLSKNDDNKN